MESSSDSEPKQPQGQKDKTIIIPTNRSGRRSNVDIPTG